MYCWRSIKMSARTSYILWYIHVLLYVQSYVDSRTLYVHTYSHCWPTVGAQLKCCTYMTYIGMYLQYNTSRSHHSRISRKTFSLSASCVNSYLLYVSTNKITVFLRALHRLRRKIYMFSLRSGMHTQPCIRTITAYRAARSKGSFSAG